MRIQQGAWRSFSSSPCGQDGEEQMSGWVSNGALTMFCPHGKGSLLECHRALPSAHRQRIWVAGSRLPLVISGNEGLLPGYVGVGPSGRTRTPAEQRLKRTWGPGCPWGPQPQERPTDWTQVPWFPPCFPTCCLLTLFSALAPVLARCSCPRCLSLACGLS